MTTDTDHQNILLWVDTETSGLDPKDCELLEVAAIVTDTNLVELTDEHFHALVAHTPEEAHSLYARATPLVRKMHTDNGIWQAVQGSEALPLAEVDEALLAFVRRFAPEPRQARMAGSSLRLDMNFGDVYLPQTMAHLHYRSVDVSAVQFLADEWVGEDVANPHAADSDHTAFADIQASLDRLRHLRRVLSERTF
jgi:oligoribonuclease